MRLQLITPTEASPAGNAARRLHRLVGTALAAADGSVGALVLLALGDALASAESTLGHALDEAFADTASSTLGQWEALVGLPVREGAALSERRRAIVAKLRASLSGTAPDILSTVRTLASEARLVSIAARHVRGTAPRNTYLFAILLSELHWGNPPVLAELDRLLAQQVTAHRDWAATVGAGGDLDEFRCDDPDSLCDRDLLAF